MKGLGLEEYKTFRSEVENESENILANLPTHFSMKHLEILKIILPEKIDHKLEELKYGTKLR